MSIHVLTLFPNMFSGVLQESILKRALDSGAAQIHLIDFRNYTKDRHRTVDDTPYGGGAGMLLKPEPLFEAVDDIVRQGGPLLPPSDRVVLLSPTGRPFNQERAREYSNCERLVFLCGHYEGFDDRVRQHLATEELSLGDFVMTGGEIAAMAVIDAVVRLLPGVLGNADSLSAESHTDGLLEYPQFTRPPVYRGAAVPDTLLSGNHQRIAEWRDKHALYRTWRLRPEMLKLDNLTPQQRTWLSAFERGDFTGIDVQYGEP
ncbi:tRNA (guanosine(37)-N1)-methyltransferase TrmD [Alicyclobacillus acidiphilus]|uniref:tRNA (guanosine(37)-N1)-methyltransferase TrmD n=1 Tax=Alicyclobacillus acidiphilus TaxID=182455 RepID=UPI00082B2797|nr:tRNA (guanosine(37)-N1)-methyltransferase TrmD [Alicyclobacillus acidiphilus]